MPPLNTSEDIKFNGNTATGKSTDWIGQVSSAESPKLTHTEQQKLWQYELQQNDEDTHTKNRPLCDKSHRASTRHLPSVPQTIKLTLTQPFRIANNTILQTQLRLHRRHPYGSTILRVGQNICIEIALEHTWTNQGSWLPSTQLFANES